MNIFLTFKNDFNTFINVSNYYYLNERIQIIMYIFTKLKNFLMNLKNSCWDENNSTIIEKNNSKFKIYKKNISIVQDIQFNNDTFYVINNKSTLFNSYLVNGVLIKNIFIKPNIVLNLNNILLCSLKMNLIKNTF